MKSFKLSFAGVLQGCLMTACAMGAWFLPSCSGLTPEDVKNVVSGEDPGAARAILAPETGQQDPQGPAPVRLEKIASDLKTLMDQVATLSKLVSENRKQQEESERRLADVIQRMQEEQAQLAEQSKRRAAKESKAEARPNPAEESGPAPQAQGPGEPKPTSPQGKQEGPNRSEGNKPGELAASNGEQDDVAKAIGLILARMDRMLSGQESLPDELKQSLAGVLERFGAALPGKEPEPVEPEKKKREEMASQLASRADIERLMEKLTQLDLTLPPGEKLLEGRQEDLLGEVRRIGQWFPNVQATDERFVTTTDKATFDAKEQLWTSFKQSMMSNLFVLPLTILVLLGLLMVLQKVRGVSMQVAENKKHLGSMRQQMGLEG